MGNRADRHSSMPRCPARESGRRHRLRVNSPHWLPITPRPRHLTRQSNLCAAIEEPLRQIVAKAGLEGSIVVNKVKEGKDDFGYNAATDQ